MEQRYKGLACMADYGSLEVPQTDIYKLKAQQSCDEDPVQV